MPVDQSHLREVVETLERIERPSASAGEREAAEWIAARFRALGIESRIEEEPAHGTYWIPLGLLTAAAGLAGLAAARGGILARALGAAVGAAAAAGIADDVSGGPHVLRRALPKRSTYNVVAEIGDASAERTVVFISHHDAAHGGFVFRPELVEKPADWFPEWFDRQETSPQIMQLVAAGPALVALGSLTGLRPLRRLGTALSFGSAASFADIARSKVVPGANDNLTAVATILELGRLLEEDPPPPRVRVVLLSTGSEESFMEGMRGFGRRHFASLNPATTRFICVESLGSPQLIVIEGEGMIKMRDYHEGTRDFLAECGEKAGVPLRRGLRLGLASDGLIAMKAGFDAAVLASVTKYKFPANYHSQSDVSANVHWPSVTGAVKVCHEVVRSSSAP